MAKKYMFIIPLQILILYASFYFFKLIKIKTIKGFWVIGVDEIASNIYFLKNLLNPSVSVSLQKNLFHNLQYDYSLNINNKYFRYLCRLIYAPLLLGYLANKSTHFWYIWSTGFLLDRDYEFKFLKSKKIKIVCYFCGDDIRSIKLTNLHAKKNKIDTHTFYIENKYSLSNSYEMDKKKLAQSADKYADVIFNHKTCQISHIKSKHYFGTYMYDKNKFFKNNNKFKDLVTVKILHAPSNPCFKGTQLVRAAIKKLEIEKYNIEYTECIKVKNDLVLKKLKSSHIVLNQFYGFSPGLFGIEAMANHCAVLMSAEPITEFSQKKIVDAWFSQEKIVDAWMVTKYWELYDNLKYLLDNPGKIKYYADNGYDFTYKHFTYEAAGDYINSVLKENNLI